MTCAADRWTEADYEAALETASGLMDAMPYSPAEHRLDEITIQIEHYEKEHYPMELPYQVTCAKCGLLVTLYAPVEKADGSREFVCLACWDCDARAGHRRTVWPPAYETKVIVPMECKCGDCECQRKEE